MKVLHVYSGNLFGGIEAILIAIARGRASDPSVDHEFALCFEGRLADELRAAGARVHALGQVRISRPHSAHAARLALHRVLESVRPDRVVCHAPWSQAIFGSVVRRAGIPSIFWAHDVMTGRHWTERLAARVMPDLVICNSEYTAGSRGALYPDAPFVVIYAPVKLALTAMSADDRTRVRTSLNTPLDAVVILQASRSEAWKGHALLIDALIDLRALPGWICWQVGGAQRPAEARFLESVKRVAEDGGVAGRVRWIGERTDVPRLLAAADIHCQANIRPEPFGIVFVEALAAGLPVVTTDLGGAREIVDDRCGVLVPPQDTRRLATALGRLIEDATMRRRLGAEAPSRARRLCDPSTQIRALNRAIERMAAVEVAAGA